MRRYKIYYEEVRGRYGNYEEVRGRYKIAEEVGGMKHKIAEEVGGYGTRQDGQVIA
jgi:hypothetical protein